MCGPCSALDAVSLARSLRLKGPEPQRLSIDAGAEE